MFLQGKEAIMSMKIEWIFPKGCNLHDAVILLKLWGVLNWKNYFSNLKDLLARIWCTIMVCTDILALLVNIIKECLTLSGRPMSLKFYYPLSTNSSVMLFCLSVAKEENIYYQPRLILALKWMVIASQITNKLNQSWSFEINKSSSRGWSPRNGVVVNLQIQASDQCHEVFWSSYYNLTWESIQ